MLGALAVDVAAVQSDVAQNAIIELREQVAPPRPFLPLHDLVHQVYQQPRRGRRSPYPGPRRHRNWPTCIDTISKHIDNLIENFGLSPNQIDFIRDVNHKLVTMTNWMPDLAGHKGPRYRAIAETLAEDVRNGRLAAGTRLPTHRDLAWKLRVTIGTVSRAYAEAERRGLIAGEVGRGTFVRPLGGGAAARPIARLPS